MLPISQVLMGGGILVKHMSKIGTNINLTLDNVEEQGIIGKHET